MRPRYRKTVSLFASIMQGADSDRGLDYHKMSWVVGAGRAGGRAKARPTRPYIQTRILMAARPTQSVCYFRELVVIKPRPLMRNKGWM